MTFKAFQTSKLRELRASLPKDAAERDARTAAAEFLQIKRRGAKARKLVTK